MHVVVLVLYFDWLGALGVTRADKDYFVHPHLSKLFFRRLCVLKSHQAEVKHAKTHFELRLLKEEAVFGTQFLKIPVNSSVTGLQLTDDCGKNEHLHIQF